MHWLKSRREQLGIDSQDELARLLQLEGINVTRAAVSHWENGTRNLPIERSDYRQALSKILKISELELLRLEGFNLPLAYSEEAARAANIIEQLSPERRELALKLLEQLL